MSSLPLLQVIAAVGDVAESREVDWSWLRSLIARGLQADRRDGYRWQGTWLRLAVVVDQLEVGTIDQAKSLLSRTLDDLVKP